MKVLTKKIIIICILAVASLTSIITTPVFAADEDTGSHSGCDTSFLGLVPWNCNITSLDDSKGESKENILKADVAIIATNVLTDLTIIATYLVVGYVIYGGYLYMFSSGDPGKAASGKNTLLHAFIGLAIVLSANIILSTIRIALIGNTQLAALDADANTSVLITNLIQWVVGVAGLVAVAFLVIGGISYLTSSGDATKLQKAKNTILYALIGLVIVALAEIITAFVSNTIRNAAQQNETANTVKIINIKELS